MCLSITYLSVNRENWQDAILTKSIKTIYTLNVINKKKMIFFSIIIVRSPAVKNPVCVTKMSLYFKGLINLLFVNSVKITHLLKVYTYVNGKV